MRCPAVFNRAAWLFAALSALGAPLAQAQTTAGFADYFILGQDEHVWNLMNRVRVGEQAAAFPTPNRLNSAVAATATADGQIVIYDHWEDGLEANIQVPVQTSTLLLGDGINSNGRACDWTTDPRVFPCTGDPLHDDRLFAGTPLSFSSDQGMGGACAAPYAVPPDASQVRCSFPVSPVIVRLSRAAGTVTVQTEAAHPFVAGTSVRIAGANEPEYNGTFSVVASTSVTRAVTSLTQAGTTITATTPLAHGLAVGDLVSIEGATP